MSSIELLEILAVMHSKFPGITGGAWLILTVTILQGTWYQAFVMLIEYELRYGVRSFIEKN